MTKKSLIIATRKSPLALWQAEYVKQRLQQEHPELSVELLPMSTRGDKILDTPLAKIGGKGLFLKELEQAILAGEADIAVHSMKDVPMDFPDGLALGVVCPREDPRDAFVSKHYDSLDDLPVGAAVGTCSLRRQAQILALRPDLNIVDLRGNVQTRLSKLDAGEYDAIILAAAGLIRLGLGERICDFIDAEVSLPAAGQGAVGIELRSDDLETLALLTPLQDLETERCVAAERALSKRLDGGCQVPIAAYAIYDNGQISMRARVAQIDGTIVLQVNGGAPAAEAEILGSALAEQLLGKGAHEILAEIYRDGVAKQ